MTEVGKLRLFFCVLCFGSLAAGLAWSSSGDDVMGWISLVSGTAFGLVWLFGFRDAELLERIHRGETVYARNMLARSYNANATAHGKWAAQFGVPEGTTVLMLAVRTKDVELVKALLAAGADRTAAASDGKTATVIAQEQSSPELVELLGGNSQSPA